MTFDQTTGLVKSLTNLQSQDVTVVSQSFGIYSGISGDNSDSNKQASGAYIFRPNCTATQPHAADKCRVPAPVGSYTVVQVSPPPTNSHPSFARFIAFLWLPIVVEMIFLWFLVVKGGLVQELRQTLSPWMSQIVRLYTNSTVLEFEWQIGAIPVRWEHLSFIRLFCDESDSYAVSECDKLTVRSCNL